MKNSIKAFIIMGTLSFHFSCGSKDEDPAPDEHPVVSVVGNPTSLTVEMGNTVTLDASDSKDPEGKSLTFSWEILDQPTESTVSLTNTNAATVTFLPTKLGDYKVKVSCSDGAKVSAKEVTVKAVAAVVVYPQDITSDITSDVVWKNINPTPGGTDYIVKNSININAKLTIEPGVIVQVESNHELYVGAPGKLVAIGTANDHIVFKAKSTSGPDWKGIVVASASDENELNYVEINFAGSAYLNGLDNKKASLALEGENAAKIKILNTQIKKGGGYGIYVENNATITSAENIEITEVLGTSMALPLNQLGSLSENNKFKGNNGYDAIEVLGSEINLTNEVTWKGFADLTTYWVSGNLLVKSGLVIQPGVNIEFASEKFMEVSGNAYVTAVGTVSQPISFSGKSKTNGFWKGIIIATANTKNQLSHVRISNAGSGFLPGTANVKASLAINGSNLSKVSISNSIISDGLGYGMFVESGAELIGFSANEIKTINGTAISLPANSVGQLDAASKFSNGNTVNAVEIQSSVLAQLNEVQWKAFTDGTKYLVSGNVEIRSGLKIEAGATFEFSADRTLIISNENDSYIIAKGTAAKKILFTGKNKSKGYWKGIAILSGHFSNEFDYVEISYAGGGFLTGLSNTFTNLGIDGDNGAKLTLTNSLISNGKGWGLVAESGSTLNANVKTANTFTANEAGAYKVP